MRAFIVKKININYKLFFQTRSSKHEVDKFLDEPHFYSERE